ncbi:MAG TPA: DNA-binding protein [Candidatus Avisuccinivibrio pullicola]|nr:DNA-binding protein [Candidatus Avisuccinivibrio pullicola]
MALSEKLYEIYCELISEIEESGQKVTVTALKNLADSRRGVSSSKRDCQAAIDRWRDELAAIERITEIPDEVSAQFMRSCRRLWAELSARFGKETAAIAREADEKVADARAARDSCRERIDALEESLAVSAREREADRRLIEELRMKVEMLTSGKTSLESDNARLREKIADSERMVDRLSAILSSKLNASGADEEQEVKED